MEHVIIPEERPLFTRVLQNARVLLEQRGWTPHGPVAAPPRVGPLRLNAALWEGSRWGAEGQFVDPQAAGRAAQALCVILYGPKAADDDYYAFVPLGQWERAEGRTEEEVLRLLDRCALKAAKAVRDW